MSGGGGTEVREVLQRSLDGKTRYREFGWDPPRDVWSGWQLSSRELKVWDRANNISDFVYDPTNRVLWAGDVEGATQPLKLTAPTSQDRNSNPLNGGTRTANIGVHRRDRGEFKWNLASTWGVGDRVTTRLLRLWVGDISRSDPEYEVTAPPGGNFTAAGDAVAVSARVKRDRYYKEKTIAGTVKVVADIRALAEDTAIDDMRSGDCWDRPRGGAGGRAVDDFEGDTNGDKTLAQEILDELPHLNHRELLSFLNSKTEPDDRDQRTGQYMWNLSNGLQVRYKPSGDGRRGTSICIEGKTVSGFAWDPRDVAFKVMRNGNPGPKGQGDTMPPAWVRNGTDRTFDAYMDTACDQTHIALNI
jgi:hypothetical protein